MEIIFENKSIGFICNAINSGTLPIDFPVEHLEIKSLNKPDFIIKIVEIEILEYIKTMLFDNKFRNKPLHKLETSFYDFVVFAISEEDNQNTLTVAGFLELFVANKFYSPEKIQWDLETPEWSLVKLPKT